MSDSTIKINKKKYECRYCKHEVNGGIHIYHGYDSKIKSTICPDCLIKVFDKVMKYYRKVK